MRGATSKPSVTTPGLPVKVMRLPGPPSVAGTAKEPVAVPSLATGTVPRSTMLPPGRRQEMAIDDPGVKFAALKLTVWPTVARVVESVTVGDAGIVTVTLFVCCRKTVPSPRTEFCPAFALAGTCTVTVAPPVLFVVTVPTVTHAPLTSQRICTTSCLPYPLRVTLTESPGDTVLGVTLIFGATSKLSVTTPGLPVKLMRLSGPPSVAGTAKEPVAVPSLATGAVPRSTMLPPGRFQVMAIDEPGVKFAALKLTVWPTVPRVVESVTVGDAGMVTVTPFVCCAFVKPSARTEFKPAAAFAGTCAVVAPAPLVVSVPT